MSFYFSVFTWFQNRKQQGERLFNLCVWSSHLANGRSIATMARTLFFCQHFNRDVCVKVCRQASIRIAPNQTRGVLTVWEADICAVNWSVLGQWLKRGESVDRITSFISCFSLKEDSPGVVCCVGKWRDLARKQKETTTELCKTDA